MSGKKCTEENVKPLSWNESFSVNARALDDQHKQLFEIINQLRSACASGMDNTGLLKIIDALYCYSATHFKDEEAFLQKKESPLLDTQQSQHAVFLDYIIDLETRIKSGSARVDEDILTFVMVWWEEHILKLDKQYSTLF